MTRQRSKIAFFIVALLWGSSFAVQKPLLEFISPVSFTFWNFFLSGMVFLIYALVKRVPLMYRWREGIILGVFLSGMEILQMVGLRLTLSADTVFITNLGMLIIPFVSFVIFRKKIKLEDNLAIILAISGMYLLVGGVTGFSFGDGILLLSALSCAFYFVYSEKFEGEKSHHITALCIQQFFTVAFICLVWGLFSNLSFAVDHTIRFTVLWNVILFTTIPYAIVQWACGCADEMIAAIYDGVVEPLAGAFFSWIVFLEATSATKVAGAMIMIFAFIFSTLFSKRHFFEHLILKLFKYKRQ